MTRRLLRAGDPGLEPSASLADVERLLIAHRRATPATQEPLAGRPQGRHGVACDRYGE